MSSDWNGFLALARRLSTESDEASQRSAISRAYYAAFNVAREYLENLGVRIPRNEAHRFVWTNLAQGPGRKPRAASRGQSLRDRRNEADYDPSFPGDLRRAAESAWKDAEAIIGMLAQP